MQNIWKHVSQVLHRVLTAGMLFQTALGMCWALVGLINGGWHSVIYLLQLAATFAGGCMLLSGCGIRSRLQKVTGAGWLMTSPVILQSHWAADGIAPAVAMLMFDAAFCIRFFKKEKAGRKDMLLPLAFWLAGGIFRPEYLLFGLVPVLAVMLRYLWICQNKAAKTGALGAAALLILFSALEITGAVGTKTDMNIGEALMTRCVWSSIPHVYDSWPEGIREVLPKTMAMEAYYRPEQMEEVFLAGFRRLPEDEQTALYKIMTDSALACRKGAVFKEMAYDLLGYGIPGIIVNMQLEGKGYHCFTAVNYQEWMDGREVFAGFYMAFYGYWFVISGVILLCLFIGNRKYSKKEEQKQHLWICGCAIIMAVLQAGYYTLYMVGRYDYRLATCAALMWGLVTLLVMNDRKGPVE